MAKQWAVGDVLIGRCESGCRTRHRVEIAQGLGECGIAVMMPKDGELVERYLNPEFYQKWQLGPRCIVHRRSLQYVKLRARQTETPCNDACVYAVAVDCKCSCGGMNHGTECR